jgi:hypothetical protein
MPHAVSNLKPAHHKLAAARGSRPLPTGSGAGPAIAIKKQIAAWDHRRNVSVIKDTRDSSSIDVSLLSTFYLGIHCFMRGLRSKRSSKLVLLCRQVHGRGLKHDVAATSCDTSHVTRHTSHITRHFTKRKHDGPYRLGRG